MADENNENETPARQPETIRNLADLGAATQAAAAQADGVAVPVTTGAAETVATEVAPSIDAQGRSYATGKRKNAIAACGLNQAADALM